MATAGLQTSLATIAHDPADCFFRHISGTARTVAAAYDTALRPWGLTASQFNLLMTSARNGPLSTGALAAYLATDRSTLPRLLRPLLARKLVRQRQGQDRRIRIVAVTAAGESLLQRALPAWLALQDTLIRQVGASRWRRTRASLGRVRRKAAGAR